MSDEEWLYDPDELAAIEAWRPDVPAASDDRQPAGGLRRSASAAVVAAAMLGLRDALEPPRDQGAVVVESPGEPDDPSAPVALVFDPESPQATVAIVRRR